VRGFILERRGTVRYHLFVLTAALALAVSAFASRAQADVAASDDHPATVPADVQLEPVLSDQFATPPTPSAIYAPPQYVPSPPVPALPSPGSMMTPVAPSYFPPAQPGAYPNIPAGWAEYGAAQPAVPCEATGCNNDTPWTHWYFEADLVGFTRDNDSRKQDITPSLRTTDLNFGMAAGPYLVLGAFIDPHNQWQLVYLIAPNMSADSRDRGFGTDVDYESTFQSAELNYLHTWNHWSFLAGFRYLRLDDRFILQDSFPDVFDMRAANNFYGGQIGVTFHHEWSWILVDWAAKLGIYGNSAVEHGTLTESGTLTAKGDAHLSTGATSVEFDLFLGHRFSPHWMGRIGLISLGVGNVALAPDMNEKMEADRTVSVAGLTIGVLGQW
jgi:hypothetical protein